MHGGRVQAALVAALTGVTMPCGGHAAEPFPWRHDDDGDADDGYDQG